VPRTFGGSAPWLVALFATSAQGLDVARPRWSRAQDLKVLMSQGPTGPAAQDFKVSRGVHPISACALRNRPLVAGGWLLFVAHALWNDYSRLKGPVT
jgi:hypothetical protein